MLAQALLTGADASHVACHHSGSLVMVLSCSCLAHPVGSCFALVMQVPVVASNRIGKETFANSNITFYGGSFISGQYGNILKQVGVKDDDEYLKNGNIHPNPPKVEGFVVQEFDLDQCRQNRVG